MNNNEKKYEKIVGNAPYNHNNINISICKISELEITDNIIFINGRVYDTRKVSENRTFQAGSISKPIFSLVVMKLADMGVVSLDANINDYLTTWKLSDTKGQKQSITLRQILSHTGAISIPGFPGYKTSDIVPDMTQILNGSPPSNTSRVQVIGQPGQQFQYSGGGMTVAQQAIVDVTQQSFPELMQKLIMDPVRMLNSSYGQPVPEVIVKGYDENGCPVPGGHHIYPELAAAGLWSTSVDLARLGVEVMKTYRGKSSRLALSQNALTSMLQPQLTHEQKGDNFMGLGWFCSGNYENFCISHSGQTEGFTSQLSLLPEKGEGMVIMINSLQGWPVIQQLLDDAGFGPAII